MACHASAGVGPAEIPGEGKSVGTQIKETASSLVQNFAPVRQIGLHFCAFHFYADNPSRQVEAHHYCSHLNDEVHQCVIYESDDPKARLIGVEFVISERLYGALSPEEKLMWHSHEYEVKSGILVCPELAEPIERPFVEDIVRTYGKTWHFWQVDRGDPLPLGVPQLMGAFYKDGQIQGHLVKEIEQRYNLDIDARRKSRAGFQGPLLGGKDAMQERYEKGKGFSLELTECDLEGGGGTKQGS